MNQYNGLTIMALPVKRLLPSPSRMRCGIMVFLRVFSMTGWCSSADVMRLALSPQPRTNLGILTLDGEDGSRREEIFMPPAFSTFYVRNGCTVCPMQST